METDRCHQARTGCGLPKLIRVSLPALRREAEPRGGRFGAGGGLAFEDKHHKGMAPASSDISPWNPAGWCLPASSGILELAIQQSPTRGGTDGKVHRD